MRKIIKADLVGRRMKKIPKRPAERARGPVRVSAVRRRSTIAPPSPQEHVDMAFMAALMYLPDQRARGLASDALVRRVDLREAAREIVEAAKRVGWDGRRSLAVLASYVKAGLGGESARR